MHTMTKPHRGIEEVIHFISICIFPSFTLHLKAFSWQLYYITLDYKHGFQCMIMYYTDFIIFAFFFIFQIFFSIKQTPSALTLILVFQMLEALVNNSFFSFNSLMFSLLFYSIVCGFNQSKFVHKFMASQILSRVGDEYMCIKTHFFIRFGQFLFSLFSMNNNQTLSLTSSPHPLNYVLRKKQVCQSKFNLVIQLEPISK